MRSMKTLSLYRLLAIFIAALSGGIALLINEMRSDGPGVEVLIPTPTPRPELRVYVSGSVGAPGVYAMDEGDRLADAITAAGGVAEGARLSCINLALRVRDEAHIHVPGIGEPCQAVLGPAAAQNAEGKIDLNSANVGQLESLPGIGEVKARAIVVYRESNGPFKSVEEIVLVRGIGPPIYESIRDLVYVGEASP